MSRNNTVSEGTCAALGDLQKQTLCANVFTLSSIYSSPVSVLVCLPASFHSPCLLLTDT